MHETISHVLACNANDQTDFVHSHPLLGSAVTEGNLELFLCSPKSCVTGGERGVMSQAHCHGMVLVVCRMLLIDIALCAITQGLLSLM